MNELLPKLFQLTERGFRIGFRHVDGNLEMRADHDWLDQHLVRLVSGTEMTSLRAPDAPLELFLRDCGKMWTADRQEGDDG